MNARKISVFARKNPIWANLVKKKYQNCRCKLRFGIYSFIIFWDFPMFSIEWQPSAKSPPPKMKAPPTLEENSRKIEIESLPPCTTPHENQSQPQIPREPPQTNPNTQNSIAMPTFSAPDWKYPPRKNLDQKIKIVSLSWNLVPRLIQMCRI